MQLDLLRWFDPEPAMVIPYSEPFTAQLNTKTTTVRSLEIDQFSRYEDIRPKPRITCAGWLLGISLVDWPANRLDFFGTTFFSLKKSFLVWIAVNENLKYPKDRWWETSRCDGQCHVLAILQAMSLGLQLPLPDALLGWNTILRILGRLDCWDRKSVV